MTAVDSWPWSSAVIHQKEVFEHKGAVRTECRFNNTYFRCCCVESSEGTPIVNDHPRSDNV